MGEIVTRIEKRGLTITALKLIKLTKEQAEKIYEVHVGKQFYETLINHIIVGPILAMVVKGPNAISVLRNMIGTTNPLEAGAGTIRGDFALNIQKNIIHAADSPENANREIKILFNPLEILDYQKPTEVRYLI